MEVDEVTTRTCVLQTEVLEGPRVTMSMLSTQHIHVVDAALLLSLIWYKPSIDGIPEKNVRPFQCVCKEPDVLVAYPR